MHCHLCFGIDDGPRTLDEAIEMCELAKMSGTNSVAAVAHLHPQWPKSTKATIVQCLEQLELELRKRQVEINIVPASEVLIQPDILDQLSANQLVTVGNHGKHLLVELPPSIAINVSQLFSNMKSKGVQPILAHPERHSHLLDDAETIEKLIQAGGLMQINASSITGGLDSKQAKIKTLFERRMVHVVGSDGHRISKRRPVMDHAFEIVSDWIGPEEAIQIFCSNGERIISGDHVKASTVLPLKKRFWFF